MCMYGSSKLPGSSGALAFVSKLLRTSQIVSRTRNAFRRAAWGSIIPGIGCQPKSSLWPILRTARCSAASRSCAEFQRPLLRRPTPPGNDKLSPGSASQASSRII